MRRPLETTGVDLVTVFRLLCTHLLQILVKQLLSTMHSVNTIHSSSSNYTPNSVQIGKNFLQTDGRTFIRLTPRRFSHIARMPDETDAKSFPLGELEETTRTPSYYVDEDYPAGPEIQ